MQGRSDSTGGRHIPVLYQEVLDALLPRAGMRYVDGTVGAGGHAFGILERSSPDGELLGLDLDRDALRMAEKNLSPYQERVRLVQGSYSDLSKHCKRNGWTEVNGVLMDLGLSSAQLANPARGFSFQTEGPLDMRFDQSASLTASDLVNEISEVELADILYNYGEERQSRRIARQIVQARPISSTIELRTAIEKGVRGKRGRIHPATRTFQALRIAVNGELDTVQKGLEEALMVLTRGGRLAVIAFHSLEDRIVKQFMRREAEGSLSLVSRKAILASQPEIDENPRARSARLRVAERL